MKMSHLLQVLYACALTAAVPSAFAQGGAEEAAVWSAIESQWRAEQRGDNMWVEQMLTSDFVGWPGESPAPRNKTSTRLWADFSANRAKILEYELYPMSITVHGDTAVAHYLFTTAVEREHEDVTVSNGRYTDVLVRIEGAWKFISWHGGTDRE